MSEYQGEGNNLGIVEMPVTLTPPPDLQVDDPIIVPTRANVGQQIDVTYTVTNAGGDTVVGQEKWQDLIYLSRDTNLDLKADRYLGTVEREDPLGAGQSYTVTTTVDLPPDMVGPYYVFVVTDAPLKSAQGMVYESNERNNDRASDVPLVIEQPPASDLQVTAVVSPLGATIGAPFSITWTVTNLGQNPASGRWSDAVYISPNTAWQLSNPFVGRVEFNGTLQPGESYTQTLAANVPSLTPGTYHVLVRSDIFNEVFEAPNESNNTTASGNVVHISAVPLELDVPYETTLDTGQQRLFQVEVPEGRTLRVTAVAGDPDAATQLYISGGVAPTSTMFDASSGGVLALNKLPSFPAPSRARTTFCSTAFRCPRTVRR